MHLTLSRRTLSRLLTVAALAVTAFAFSAGSGAADSFYTWPGAVILHVHTTPADSSPGYVQSDPYYVDCPNACDRPYDPGSSVTLWAHPTGGFVFTSWTTGPCAGSTANPCTFTISADTDVTADFSGHYVPTAPGETNNLQVYPLAICCYSPFGPSRSTKAPALPSVIPVFDFLGMVTSTDGKISCSVFNAYFLYDYTGCSAEEPQGAVVQLQVGGGDPFCALFLVWEEDGSTGTQTIVMNGNVVAAPVSVVNPICVI